MTTPSAPSEYPTTSVAPEAVIKGRQLWVANHFYMQSTSPGADKGISWLPTSASIPMMTPLMRLYWPLPNALDGTWTSPSAVEVP
jgi:hypothetical protein